MTEATKERLCLVCEGELHAEENGPACDGCKQHRRDSERDRLEARIKHCGLPTSLQNVAIPSGAAGDAARRWVEEQDTGLCLTGPVGVGKTYLAAAACWARVQRRPVRWVSAARLMNAMRSGFDTERRAQAIAAVAGNGAVVLDDLDKVNPSEYGREVLFAAIDGRVEEGSPLLVTTNKSMSEIGALLGDPVMSRLAGYCQVVRMSGEDRRIA